MTASHSYEAIIHLHTIRCSLSTGQCLRIWTMSNTILAYNEPTTFQNLWRILTSWGRKCKNSRKSCISNTDHTMRYHIVQRFPYTRKRNFVSYTRTFITEGNIMTFYLRHPQLSRPALAWPNPTTTAQLRSIRVCLWRTPTSSTFQNFPKQKHPLRLSSQCF